MQLLELVKYELQHLAWQSGKDLICLRLRHVQSAAGTTGGGMVGVLGTVV